MTCKDCIHYEACGGFIPTDLDQDVFDYCRKGIADEIPNIEERCSCFMDKADVVEVKHGEWISVDADVIFKCSICEAEISTSWDYENENMFAYCPCCGAKMGGASK